MDLGNRGAMSGQGLTYDLAAGDTTYPYIGVIVIPAQTDANWELEVSPVLGPGTGQRSTGEIPNTFGASVMFTGTYVCVASASACSADPLPKGEGWLIQVYGFSDGS